MHLKEQYQDILILRCLIYGEIMSLLQILDLVPLIPECMIILKFKKQYVKFPMNMVEIIEKDLHLPPQYLSDMLHLLRLYPQHILLL